jgi:hypothetical protein
MAGVAVPGDGACAGVGEEGVDDTEDRELRTVRSVKAG